MFNPWVKNSEEEMAARSSTLACRIPWTKEPGGLRSMESQRQHQEQREGWKQRTDQSRLRSMRKRTFHQVLRDLCGMLLPVVPEILASALLTSHQYHQFPSVSQFFFFFFNSLILLKILGFYAPAVLCSVSTSFSEVKSCFPS